jgi:hypothetical protein
MTDDDDKRTSVSDELSGGGLTSDHGEEHEEQADKGDSEDEEQAVRESTDQFDTTGTE